MGWRDDPVVAEAPWQRDPVVAAQPTTREPSLLEQAAADVGGGAIGRRLPADVVKRSALPLAGSFAVPAAATALLGPANAPFVGLEMGAGNALGTAGNMALGMEPWSGEELLKAAVIPPAVEKGVGVLRALKAIAPTAAGARNLNVIAEKEASNVAQTFKPVVPSKQLFEEVDQVVAPIATARTEAAIQNELSKIEVRYPGLKGTEIADRNDVYRYLTALKDKLDPAIPKAVKPAGQPYKLTPEQSTQQQAEAAKAIAENAHKLKPSQIQQELKDLGDAAAAFEGTQPGKALSTVKHAMLDDLGLAIKEGAPGAKALKEARRTYLREMTLKDMMDSIDKRFISKRGMGGDMQFNANQVMNDLKQNRFYEKAFTTDERADIHRTLTMLNRIPPLAPGAGVNYGSGRTVDAVKTLGFRPMQEISNNLIVTMQTGEGRAMLQDLLKNSDGAWTPNISAAVAAFARAATDKTATVEE